MIPQQIEPSFGEFHSIYNFIFDKTYVHKENKLILNYSNS